MRPNGLYGTMLRKAAPFALKGFLYYQGEGDAHKPLLYDKLLEALIANWRADWGQAELPFLFVQLPAFGCDGDPDGEAWALLRESQAMVAERVPNAFMAVVLDCGEKDDIHPRHKRPVGERLARLAMNRVYGLDVPGNGPVCADIRLGDGRAELRFDHAGSGLAASDGREPAGFEIAGADGVFVPARAEIAGDRVVLTSPAVPEPRFVRYGWANYTEANLTNAHGLPAGSFRSRRAGREEGDVAKL
nr:sialate O-acetylesterase [Cohnella zeiphila]